MFTVEETIEILTKENARLKDRLKSVRFNQKMWSFVGSSLFALFAGVTFMFIMLLCYVGANVIVDKMGGLWTVFLPPFLNTSLILGNAFIFWHWINVTWYNFDDEVEEGIKKINMCIYAVKKVLREKEKE